ncbi:MAG: type 1 periplasmic binding fold superfamily protein [Saprospiraceae bacterium]|nr:type 1 periplasmic binding fold superfamily protein [Saprospiraceae bacterium]
MKNFQSIFFSIFLCSLILTGISSCGDDSDHNEEELITTLRYTLFDTAGNSSVVLLFRDVDGTGGNPPEFVITGQLKQNTYYTGSLQILNESVVPAIDITPEILLEGVDHQFFYGISSGFNMSFSYADADTNGKPIGINTILNTGSTSSGTLRILLRHQPDKNATGVSTGDPTNAGGETDIEVDFENLRIQ